MFVTAPSGQNQIMLAPKDKVKEKVGHRERTSLTCKSAAVQCFQAVHRTSGMHVG